MGTESLFVVPECESEVFKEHAECPILEFGANTFFVEPLSKRFPRQREWCFDTDGVTITDRLMHPVQTVSILFTSVDDNMTPGERREALIAAFLAAFRVAFPPERDAKLTREGFFPVLVWRMPPTMTLDTMNPLGPVLIVEHERNHRWPIARKIRARAAIKWEKVEG